MQYVCANDWCGATFEVTNEDLMFYDEVSPVFTGRKYPVPAPTECPPCRLQQRMSFRNERKLYHRKSDLSGKDLIGMFAQDNPYTVCDQDEWWSDSWDPLSYGRPVNFSRPFFEQLRELNLAVPHPSLNTQNVENSEYTNFSINVRNSYLVFGVTDAEDCLYGKFVITAKDVLDSLSVYGCELCYEGIASQQCYGCRFFTNCQNCSDCLMVEECTGCKDCILCFGLANKQYCYRNEEIGKEAYEEKKRECAVLTNDAIAGLRGQLDVLKASLPHRAAHIYASEDCSGDMIFNSKGCHECFDIRHCENCKFTAFTPNGVSSYDSAFTAPDGVQWCNHVLSTLGHRCMGTFMCWHVNNAYYSINCRGSDFLFGSVGLHRRKHCILNTQYPPEEYDALAGRIAQHMQQTGEWGKYMPTTLSHYAYNETIAHEYFPLTKDEALRRGWQWRDERDAPPQVERIIPASQLPAAISDIPDDILRWAVVCEATGRPFRIQKQELTFYRRTGLPVPHLHPDERHRRRLMRKPPYRLCDRACGKCGKAIRTTFASERPKIVHCEECYLKGLYS
jgi:hypothetical protein